MLLSKQDMNEYVILVCNELFLGIWILKIIVAVGLWPNTAELLVGTSHMSDIR
jgi:hypothetical protein